MNIVLFNQILRLLTSNFKTLLHRGILRIIAGFRRRVDDTCTVMGYYAGQSDNSVATFRDNISSPSVGTDYHFHLQGS